MEERRAAKHRVGHAAHRVRRLLSRAADQALRVRLPDRPRHTGAHHFVDGVAECLAVRTIGYPVTASALRSVPLGRLVREAVIRASRPASEVPKLQTMWQSVEEAQRQRQPIVEELERQTRNPRDRARITDELLARVAQVYRNELAGGRPTAEVAKQLDYSRASAGRLVMEARRRGFLPPTEERKARA